METVTYVREDMHTSAIGFISIKSILTSASIGTESIVACSIGVTSTVVWNAFVYIWNETKSNSKSVEKVQYFYEKNKMIL